LLLLPLLLPPCCHHPHCLYYKCYPFGFFNWSHGAPGTPKRRSEVTEAVVLLLLPPLSLLLFRVMLLPQHFLLV